MTTDDLVLVRPDGTVEGGGHINMAAYYIHHPVHEARPDIVSAAHCHTPYGTPFSATVTLLEPISQEACAFFGDHEIFDDEEVNIGSTDGGKRIAAAIGEARAVILRNHGLLTVGATIDAAVGYFLLMERCAEVQVKARDARPIGPSRPGASTTSSTSSPPGRCISGRSAATCRRERGGGVAGASKAAVARARTTSHTRVRRCQAIRSP